MYSSKQNRKAAQAGSSQTFELDPTMKALLYGTGNGTEGLLQKIAQQAQQGQTGGLSNFGNQSDMYLGSWGADSFNRSQQAAQKLQETTNATPNIEAARISAPSQNSLDLRSAFNRTINGDAGANPYLTRAIQGGIDQSKLAFNQMQQDATRNLNENVLTGIKSNSIISGGYGGSRQGLAEGRAIGDFAQAQQNAINQFGQANTNAAVGAQADAYNQGQNRSLQALLGLSGQQYSTAAQNAEMQQQASLANQNAYLQNNQNNAQAQATGIGLSSGLLGQAYGYAQNNNNAGFNRLTQGTGALSPFTGLGTSNTSTQPYYGNAAGDAIGGALGGLSLWSQFSRGGGGGSGASAYSGAANNWGVSAGSAPSTSWLSNSYFGGA
ncbi:hypothetical protein IP92_05749 [Pseudoduganella flava]|nr:hypothetical protein IP92_05749 [Pseudoduganella flava]